MNIRPATLSDIPQLVLMGSRFFDASGYADLVSLDPASVVATLKGMVDNADAVLLVVESDGDIVGMAGAMIYPFYFNHGHRTSQEMFWWVAPERRGGVGARLFDAMRAELKARGANSLAMIALETLEPERVGAFYRSKGLRPSEHCYVGRI